MKRFLCVFVFIGIIFSVIFGFIISREYGLDIYKGEYHYEKNWMISENDGEKSSVKLPMVLKYEKDHKYTLSSVLTYLPKVNEDPYAFISFNHMYFKVYLNNEEIYSYTPEDVPSISKSPGNAYTMIPLPYDCYGKEIKIDFWLTLESGLVYEVGDILFGDYPTVIRDTFVHDVVLNIVTICILFLGILLVLLSAIMLKDNYNAGYTGIFALIFGIYCLSENLFNLYMIANPYFTYLINFFAFAAIPIPLILLFKNKVSSKFKTIYNIVFVLLISNIIIQGILHFAKILDIRQTLIFTHILYLISFLTIIITICFTSKKEKSDIKRFVYEIIPIIIGLFIDAFVHYFVITKEGSNTFFLQLGIFIFLISEAVYIFKGILNIYKENIKSDFYKNLAYKDGLTDLYNRTAFIKKLEELNLVKNKKGLLCICVDINNLKQINDENGHQAGDMIICKTAEYLKKYFLNCGEIYRVGGDEFNIFISNIEENIFIEKIDNMYKEIEIYNKNAEIKLKFALGYEYFNSKKYDSVEKCLYYADRKMYENKEKIKS